MRDFYPQNRERKNISLKKLNLTSMKLIAVFLLALILNVDKSNAQVVYTAIEGDISTGQIGPNPFATLIKSQRSQYLYISDYLANQSAPNGYITAIALKITETAFPTTLKPQNLQIKLGLTNEVVLPATLVPNLTTYYSTPEENITATGWHTFILDTPFAWNGYSNIIVEICRTNDNTGSNFMVETTILPEGAYRTVGLSSGEVNANGCTLEGTTPLTLPSRRSLPSMQFTMTNPCSGTPLAGTPAVSDANYCNEPFVLSIVEGSMESGLNFQWQSTSDLSIPFMDIVGATDPTLTTTQDYSTYYRRSVTCGEGAVIAYSSSIFVSDIDCLCNPSVTTQNNAGISSVVFNTINNQTTTIESYGDYRSLETSVEKQSLVVLQVNVTTVEGSLTTKAWFDWNNDGVFAENEEYNLGVAASGTDVSSGINPSIEIPTSAVIGAVTMRVRTAKLLAEEVLTPCGNFDSGETEDYTVLVTPNLGIKNPELLNNSIVVISNNSQLDIRSSIDPISALKVYDLRGRVLFNKIGLSEINSTIQLNAVSDQLLIIEVKTVSGFTAIRKVNVR